MMPFKQAGLAGFFIVALITLSACSDSTDDPANANAADTPAASGDPLPDGADSNAGTGAGTGAGAGSESGTSAGAGSDSGTGAGTGSESGTGADAGSQTSAGADAGSQTSAGGGPTSGSAGGTQGDGSNEPTAEATSSGADDNPADDDSPTAAESASLAGPFISDPARGAGPPSAPTDLTLLLSAENWLEFTWAPSTDDQSVEAYEIYRDGELIFTVRGDTGYEFDYNYWLSTSFQDCNYTRFTQCETLQPMEGASYEYTVVAVDNEGGKSPPSQGAVFALNTLENSTVDLTGYEVVFNEDFDGTELDRSRWKTALPWGEDTYINGETQHYVNLFGNDPVAYDPFVFTGSTLQITAIETPPALLEEVDSQPYLSGVISTSDHFEMTYGYVEMRARAAGGDGLLSTFYLFNQGFYKSKPEIDILEYIGGRPDKNYQTYHYFDSNRARSAAGEKHSSPTMETDAGVDLSADFHTYSALWEPGLVVWYIDGIEVRRLTGPRVSDEPMNIIAQLVVGSDWIGAPAAASIPAVYEIDYLRAYQKP